MSKTFEFEQTSIPSQFSINLKDNYGMIWVDTRTADLFRVLFTSMTNVLKYNQSKDAKRIGMSLKDDKGHFKMGAILTFKKPEDATEEDSGNWYLEFTLDQADMNDLSIDVDNHSDIFVRCAAEAAQTICYGRFRSTEIMYEIFNTAVDTLTAFLDANSTEAEEVEISLRGIFTASVAVENGEKIMSVVPGEFIKQLVKNDAAL